MAMAATSSPPFFTGERAVVAMFVGIVLYSLPLSLLSHGVALSLLSLFALFVEILSELPMSPVSSQFKTRPGASSGILLGAVTLPTVMLSKLIQLSRAFALHEVEQEEINYLAMQYWAASACCFAVLLFLCLIIWRLVENSGSTRFCFGSAWPGLSCFLLCAGLYFFSDVGIETVTKLLWVLSHGFAAVKLEQHLLNTFSSCVSIGEALLATSGLVLYFGDMLACTIAEVHGYLTSGKFIYMQYGIKRSEISIIIQGLILGLLLFPVFFKFLLHACDRLLRGISAGSRTYYEKLRSLLFFGALGFIMVLAVPLWMQFVLDFQVHPLLWVVTFVFSEPFKRLSLCLYWVCVIFVSVLRFYNISKNSKIERILLRKYYHLMAVSMFLPAVIFQPKFLILAFGVAFTVFLALEIIRVWRIWPLGQLIHQFMNAFTDHRDSDLLIVSHFSLLLGCAIPIWMSSGFNDRPLAPFAGILSLGIGDTMASMVGYKYGVLRWSKAGKKTIEGTAAGITSVLAACSVLLPLIASTGYFLTEHWGTLLLAVVVSGLLEAYTAQLDNAFIPLVFYSLLCL